MAQPSNELADLKKKYDELQLRVTQFSKVEQQLINTKDSLDQELVMHKRLSDYYTSSLKVKNRDEFLTLTAEAIIDIFEIESSLVFFYHYESQQLDIKSEGIVLGKQVIHEIKQHFINGTHKAFDLAPILTQKDFIQLPFLQNQENGYYASLNDSHNHIYGCVFGLVSKINSNIYGPPNSRNVPLFSIFSNQVKATLNNIIQNEKIEIQLKEITNSKIELTKLSFIATKTRNSVIVTDNKGRIEWVNHAFEISTGFKLKEILGKKPKSFLHGKESDKELITYMSDNLKAKKPVKLTMINYKKSGEKFYNELEITPVFSQQGELINFISLQRDITDEIRAKENLLKINRRFESIAKSSKLGIWEYTLSENKVAWNDELYSLYGVEKQNEKISNNLNQIWLNSILEEDLPKVQQNLELLNTGKIKTIQQEYRIKNNKTNEIKYVRSITVAETDAKGKIIRFFGSSEDITENKLFEENLKASEQKYRGIIENINLGLIEVSNNRKIIFANHKYFESRGIHDIVPFALTAKPLQELNNLKKSGVISSYKKITSNNFEITINSDNKQLFTFLLSSEKVENKYNNHKGYINIFLDVTYQKELQNNLEKTLLEKNNLLKTVKDLQVFYENVLNNSPAKIVVLSSDKKIEFVNDLQIKNESEWKNTIGKPIKPLLKNRPFFYDNLNKSIKSKKLVTFEEEVTEKNGDKKYILRSILPHFNSHQKLDYIVCFGVNISELKFIQKNLVENNKELQKINTELDNFVYSVSHDLRSPLLSIKGIFNLIFQANHLTPKDFKLLKFAELSINRLDGTIQEILEYSRNSRKEVENEIFDVKEMVNEIFEDLRFSTESKVKFSFKSNGKSNIASDKTRINVLLKNTIGNAFKYQRKNIKVQRVDVIFSNNKTHFNFEISDNGQGIYKKNLAKVFQMFYRDNSESVGTGLGLYICKEIVNKMQGSISIESKKGKGTKINISIPAKI